jgi:hypothetical protein
MSSEITLRNETARADIGANAFTPPAVHAGREGTSASARS